MQVRLRFAGLRKGVAEASYMVANPCPTGTCTFTSLSFIYYVYKLLNKVWGRCKSVIMTSILTGL